MVPVMGRGLPLAPLDSPAVSHFLGCSFLRVPLVVALLCGGLAGQGDIIKCLQEHVEDGDMGQKCKEEVKKDEKNSATGT